MLEGVSPALWQGLGVFAAVLAILSSLILMLAKGLIWTKPQVDKLIELEEGRIKTAEEREAKALLLAEKWQQTAQEAIANNETDIEQNKLIISLLQAARGGQRR